MQSQVTKANKGNITSVAVQRERGFKQRVCSIRHRRSLSAAVKTFDKGVAGYDL